MIISSKHKYVFIQLEGTASSSIALELIEFYDGKEILWKHARYEDFMAIATPEEKKYFKFSGIRNPLDKIVSFYFSRKNGSRNDIWPNKLKYNFIKRKNANFLKYFKKYHTRIYTDWKTRPFNKLDYVYRYENLQEDFSKILKKLDLEQKRPLPLRGETKGKGNFESYYTNSIQGSAKVFFKDFMQKWDYEFPADWRQPNFYEKYFLKPLAYLKFAFKKLFYLLISHPAVYRLFYKVKEK
jgi:hypothetical protein